MSNKKWNERRSQGFKWASPMKHWRFRGDGKKYIFLTLRECKEKPWHRQPNTKHQKSLQQLSRREDMHMVQAARNINSENCIWQRPFWTPRCFRKIAGEKTHYIANKGVTYRIVVAYEKSQHWKGVLITVVLHNMLEELLIWWIIVHCILIIIIVQEHECVQVKYSIHTEHHSETSCCMNGWGEL